jgi:hypothetical protein
MPQRELAARLGLSYSEALPSDIVGVAENVRPNAVPLNGLRHPPQRGTSGWYLWAGEEMSTAPDFFVPVHAQHLVDRCPKVVPYLGLPPGSRFLIAPGWEDVWFDELLLDV